MSPTLIHLVYAVSLHDASSSRRVRATPKPASIRRPVR
jgi:hypothetical protein